MHKQTRILKILIYLLILVTFVLVGYLKLSLTGHATKETEKVNITRAIDGDTLVLEDKREVRLLGINTPEKKMLYYEEARDFLKELEGKQIEIEALGENKDKYGRYLRYVSYQNKLINEEILKQGLGNLYVYNEDKYTEKLKKAEKEARVNELGIWKHSVNYRCIELIELKYQETERCKNQEQLILNNKCQIINITIKDNANKIVKIKLERGIFTKNFSCVFNDAGDSLYVWDNEGMLLFWRY